MHRPEKTLYSSIQGKQVMYFKYSEILCQWSGGEVAVRKPTCTSSGVTHRDAIPFPHRLQLSRSEESRVLILC